MSAADPLYSELHGLEIRLLNILPGEWHEEVECELMDHAALSDNLVFDALSYAWGSTKPVRSIILNRRSHGVTANAHKALRRLRQTSGPTIVWIDALCINQSDDNERTHQVGLMRDIFTSARQVIVYLGEVQNSKSKVPSRSTFFQPKVEDDILSSFAARCSLQEDPKIPELDEAFEVFCLIHSIAEAQNLEDAAPLDAVSRRAADSKYHRRLFEALRQLMRCRWWDRMWTLQEAVVPRDVTIVYGSCVSTWDMFTRAAKAYSVHKASEAISPVPLEYTKILDFYSQTILGIETMRNRWTSGEETTLLPLLRQFSGRKATDPRDRVYALLGLVRGDSPILSDYSIDVAAVYERTALGIISSTESLSILNGDIGRKSRQDLPSWVPDWSAEYHDLDRQRSETVEHYRATPKSSFYVQQMTSNQSDADEPIRRPAYKHPREAAYEFAYHNALRAAYNAGTNDAYEVALRSSKWNEFLRSQVCGPMRTRSKCLEAIEKYLTVKLRSIEHTNNGIIRLQGYRLGQVSAVGRVNMSETDLIPTIQSWAILAMEQSKSPIEWSIFMRTLCGDIVYPSDRNTSGCRRICYEDINTIARWFIHQPISPFGREQAAKSKKIHPIRHEMEQAFPDNESSEEIYATINVKHSILMATSRRAFFMMNNGSFGMGPAQISFSDQVYAFLGAQTLFILRRADCLSLKRQDEGYDWPKIYDELIGDCFLFGAMDGEVIKEWQETLATGLERLFADNPEAWTYFLRIALCENSLIDVLLI